MTFNTFIGRVVNMSIVPVFKEKIIDGVDIKADSIIGSYELGQFLLILEAVREYKTKLSAEEVVLLLNYKQDAFSYAISFVNDNLAYIGKEKISVVKDVDDLIEKFEDVVEIDNASEIQLLQHKILSNIGQEVEVINEILSTVKAANVKNRRWSFIKNGY